MALATFRNLRQSPAQRRRSLATVGSGAPRFGLNLNLCAPYVVVHEVKHDGYRLQIHAGSGRVRLYTMNGADWTERYPRIVDEAARIKVPVVIDADRS